MIRRPDLFTKHRTALVHVRKHTRVRLISPNSGRGAAMFRIIGIVAGILSLTVLFWKGFHISFGPLLLGMLQSFELEMGTGFGLVEPFIKAQLQQLHHILGWQAQLYPHWKHVFVLMWLWFGASARDIWQQNKKLGRSNNGAVVLGLIGFVVAFAAGVMAGTVKLDGPISNMIMAAYAFVGFVVWQLCANAMQAIYTRPNRPALSASEYRVQRFFRFAGLAGHTIIVYGIPGTAILAIGTQTNHIPYLRDVPNIGIAFLFAMLMALTVYRLWLGVKHANGRGATRFQKALNDSRTRLALNVFAVIGGASFVALVGMAGV